MLKNNFFSFTSSQYARVKKNFISLLSNFSSKLLVQIFFPSLMIIVWGVKDYGIWIFVTALPSTFTFLNLHFSYAARIEMTINYARKNYKLLNSNFQNGFGLVIMNMLIYTILWLSCFLIVDLDLKIFENISDDQIRLILFIILISFYFNIFDSILVTGISYWGKINVPTYIITIADLCTKVLIIFSGLFFNNLLYPAIIFFLVSLIRTSTLYYYFLNNKKSIELSLRLINLKASLNLFKLSLSFYAENVSQLIKHNALIIILGIFYSAEIIGFINTTKTLFYFLPIVFVGIFNHVGLYEYSEAIGKKTKSFIKQNYVKHIQFISIILTLFVILSIIIGNEIYSFWTSYVYDFNTILFLLIMLNAVLYLLQSTVGTILKSANNFFKPVIFEAVISLIALIISYYYLYNNYNFVEVFKIFLFASLISLLVYCYYSYIFFIKIEKK